MRFEKLFTLEEARTLTAELRPRLRELSRIWKEMLPRRHEIKALENRALLGGGTVPFAGAYFGQVKRLNKHLSFLRDTGALLKDVSSGLVDFPSERDGRVVYLCWNMDEETIAHWHELDAGFAGRQRLDAPPAESGPC